VSLFLFIRRLVELRKYFQDNFFHAENDSDFSVWFLRDIFCIEDLFKTNFPQFFDLSYFYRTKIFISAKNPFNAGFSLSGAEIFFPPTPVRIVARYRLGNIMTVATKAYALSCAFVRSFYPLRKGGERI